MNLFIITQNFSGRLLNRWAQVNRIDNFHIIMGIYNLPESSKDPSHRLTLIFPAMHGHQNHLASWINTVKHLVMIIRLDGQLESVNSCISCHKNCFCWMVFLEQVSLTLICWRKIQVGQRVSHLTIHLFWERRVFIPSPQASFHVADTNLIIKRCKTSRKSRCRITVHQHNIWLIFL